MKSLDETLFGEDAVTWIPPLQRVTSSLDGYRYSFVAEKQYASILAQDVPRGMEIYWREILYRAHLAAGTSLLRFDRWISGVRSAYESSNAFAYAACLRAALESAADSFDGLKAVPISLAN